jgi:LytS/YehU family sensor histidine kinase
LEVFIRNWGSNPQESQYDFSEVLAWLTACLENLKQYALEAELEDISEYLTAEQAKFIKKIAGYIAD